MMRFKELSEAVKERRKVLGLTQSELAALAGVADRSVYQVETGGANPRWETLSKMMGALGLEIVFEVKNTAL